MKKLLLTLLAFTMCISMCACGDNSDNSDNSDNKKESITLTTENLNEYLEISTSYGELKSKTDYFEFVHSKIDTIVKTYASKGGSFENTEIKLEITLPLGWQYDGIEEVEVTDISSVQQKITTTLKIPTNGTFETAYLITQKGYIEEAPTRICEIKIVSVSGNFVPN